MTPNTRPTDSTVASTTILRWPTIRINLLKVLVVDPCLTLVREYRSIRTQRFHRQSAEHRRAPVKSRILARLGMPISIPG